MSRNGSGTYSLPAGNPVTTGTTISSTWANNTLTDIATALTQSIAYDGQTTPIANLPMGGFKLTGMGAGSAATDSVRLSQVQAGAMFLLGSVSGTNTVTATASPTLTAYASGMSFVLIPAVTNTGATTLNIDSLGAKNIYLGGAALIGGELVASVPVTVVYDGTQFNLMNVYQTKGTWTPTIISSGGGAPTYTTQTGRYIKTGRQVFASAVIDLATAGTLAAGTLTVGGFPFTVQNSVAARATATCSWASFSTSFINVLIRMFENTTTADLVGATAAVVTNSSVSQANFGATGGLRFGITYEASA